MENTGAKPKPGNRSQRRLRDRGNNYDNDVDYDVILAASMPINLDEAAGKKSNVQDNPNEQDRQRTQERHDRQRDQEHQGRQRDHNANNREVLKE